MFTTLLCSFAPENTTHSTFQEGFAALLKHDFNLKFPATCVYYKNYDVGSIPNPCLKIDGLGFVGLPLSERDAKAMIARATQVGSGTREISSNNVCTFLPPFCNQLQNRNRSILLMPNGASGFGPLSSRGCVMHSVSNTPRHLQNASCISY
jgi:hypothetical protein